MLVLIGAGALVLALSLRDRSSRAAGRTEPRAPARVEGEKDSGPLATELDLDPDLPIAASLAPAEDESAGGPVAGSGASGGVLGQEEAALSAGPKPTYYRTPNFKDTVPLRTSYKDVAAKREAARKAQEEARKAGLLPPETRTSVQPTEGVRGKRGVPVQGRKRAVRKDPKGNPPPGN